MEITISLLHHVRREGIHILTKLFSYVNVSIGARSYLWVFIIVSSTSYMSLRDLYFDEMILLYECLEWLGIETGSVPWQGTILPLDHQCIGE